MKLKKFFIKKLVPVITFLLFVNFTYGQRNIAGTVTGTDGEVIPGVSVIVKGTTTGTMTDATGKYSITVPDEATTLVFTYIGMETQEVEITGNVINCLLKFSDSEIAEVVVIGYGEIKKEDATGSVSTVSSDDFNQGAIISPQDLISGKTSGVQITSGGGAPGEGSVIRIRGGSSLSAINDPLIVIDGVPIDNEGVAGMRNPLNIINPNDIETFTILKDASSTAIYGSRASNGVIIITTKKGKLGSPYKISYNGNVSVSTLPKKLDVLSANEYRTVLQEQVNEGIIAEAALDLLGNENTDWQEEIFQTAINHDHNVAFSGAYNFLPFRVSLGYSDQEGILKTGTLDRITGALSLSPRFLDNHLSVNLNIKGMNINNRFADGGAVGSAVSFDPTQPVFDEGNDFGGYYVWTSGEGNPITIATKNPLSLLEQRENISTVNRLLGNLQLDYKLHFLPDLKANVNLAYDYSESNGTNIVPDNAGFDYDPSGTNSGYNSVYDETKGNELLEAYLNYSKDMSSIESEFDLMGGYSFQHIYRKGSNFSTNYVGNADTVDTDYNTEYYLISFYGRINYSFKNRYLLTASLRYDGTSRFAPENRWGLFPSTAFAWKINEEEFLKNISLISDLKLRIGYGITGQQNINQGDYPYLARYTYSENTAMYPFGDVYLNTLRPEAYNQLLKWEETTTYNIALDFGLYKDRIAGSLEFYKRLTDDLINLIPVPAGSNFNNTILSNIGSLENKGIEFTLNVRPVVKKDLFWEVGFNFTYNQSEITKLTAVTDSSYTGVPEGGISGGIGNTVQRHFTGYSPNTFFVFEQLYDADGYPIEGAFVDRNDDGVVNEEDKYYYKSSKPDYFMGFNTKLVYKDIDFSFSGRINIGNFVYNNVNSSTAFYENLYNSAGYLNNTPSAITDIGFINLSDYQLTSDYYVTDASFLKLDNVSVGYSFDNLFETELKGRVAVTVQNVLTYTKYKGLDPEVFSGIDNNIYPRPRIFMLGVNLDF